MNTQIIRVFGIVQGVGFRPFVSRIAQEYHIKGQVRNKGSYVEIVAQGIAADMTGFRYALEHNAPERSAILKLDAVWEERPACAAFEIAASTKEKGDIFVSPDIAICDACKKELFDKTNRRYLHPFINCTACGPRLTILDAMPYDRERTSMGEFPMCDACRYEYTHAETRRYDAQPVCCQDCGPEVYLIGRGERRREAITAVRRILSDGGIAAVKGIGGFHLCCDGTCDAAVRRLRNLKRRPVKPFAVMMKDLQTVHAACVVEAGQDEILDGHQKPILLLQKKENSPLSAYVAPDNPKAGVMLPYTPLHLLLFTYDDEVEMPDCLVMTSANESGAPICRTDAEAVQELDGLCDVILSHNRDIRLRADDSVMDFYDGKPEMIRRSRGYAPLPFFVGDFSGEQVLAMGGELKNTFCIGKNNLFYVSPYIGDMADIRTVQALRQSVRRMTALLEARPSVVICDMHPLYNTTAVAQDMGLPILQVQHHYAHILSCMAENNYLDPVIGVAFDGTGYGTDGTIWGSEILAAGLDGFRRLASAAPFRQLGGDASAREGWRIAVALIYAGMEGHKEKTAEVVRSLDLCSREELQAQFFLADHRINSVMSTSAGRLFDAVSAILGLCRASTFEGQAAMELQFAAQAWKQAHGGTPVVPIALRREGPRWFLPTDELVRSLMQERLDGTPAAQLAYVFHQQLAGMIVAACEQARSDTGLDTVALSGGVFQNQLLLRLCDKALQTHAFHVLRHSMIPSNDGGIALGQAVYGAAALQKKE